MRIPTPICLITALLALGLIHESSAQVEDNPKPPTMQDAKARIKKTGPTDYELGDIKFNSETREISFPATLNMAEGALEYALVHETGKTHESLLKTKTKAFDLNVVMLLCRYEPHIADLTAVLTEVRPELIAQAAKPMVRPGANHLVISVKWKDAKGEHSLPLQKMVMNFRTEKQLTAPHFTYNGSQVSGGRLDADTEGSYIALYVDFLALINSVEVGNTDDKNWIVNQSAVPPVDTPVTLTLSPAIPANAQPPKPKS